MAMTAVSEQARATVVVCAAGVLLVAAGIGFTVDPRLGILGLAAPVAFAMVASPAVGTGLLLLAMPMEELAALTGGGTLNKLLGLTAVGAWLLHVLLRRERIGVPGAALPLVGLVLWGATSTIWAVDPGETVHTLVTYLQLCGLYLLVVNVLATPASLRRALHAHVAGAAILSVIGLYLTWQGVLQRGRTAIVVDHQLLLEPNAYAAALILPVAICLTGSLDRHRGTAERLALTLAGALCVTTIILTMSRGAVVALGVMAIVVSVARGQLLLPVLAVLIAIPGLLIAPPEFWERWSQAATLADRGAGRLDIWRVGWVVIQQHPFLGVGLGCFPVVYYDYLSQAAGISWRHAQAVAEVLIKYPHNIYLGVTAELGIPGIGLLLAAFWLHLRAGFDTWRRLQARRHPAAELALTALAALLALAVQGAAFDIAHRKYLWVTLGLAAVGSLRVARAAAAPARAPVRRAA